MHVDAVLDRIAHDQLGLVTRLDTRRAGIGDDVVDRRLAAGLLVPAQPGVFRDAAVASTHEQALLAACLAAGPGAVVSHRAAASLWGIAHRDDDPPVEITVPASRTPDLRDTVVHRTKAHERRHVRRRGPLWVTTVERTLLDLGAVVPRASVIAAIERALTDDRTTVLRLLDLLDDIGARGRNGAGVLRGILLDRPLGLVRPDGMTEPIAARIFRRHDIPQPVFQHRVEAGGRFVARVDFAWPAVRLVAEVEGYEPRKARRRRQRDASRQNEPPALGWHVLRFTWEDLVGKPTYVATTVLAALDRLGAVVS